MPDCRVFGAGLAGCSVARGLARRGLSVELVDPLGIAGGASGQREAVFQPRLGGPDERDARFVRAGFHFTRALLESIDPQRSLWSDCGVAHLAMDRGDAERFRQRIARTEDYEGTNIDDFVVFLQTPEALGILGVDVAVQRSVADSIEGLLWFPSAGTLQPRKLCERMVALDAERISLRDAPSGAEVRDVVLATSHAARRLSGLEWLDLRPTRGQATSVAANDLRVLPFVVCNSGYATPPTDGLVTLAATYGKHDDQNDLRPADDDENLGRTRRNLPVLELSERAEPRLSEAGVRATTADRMPLVGQIEDGASTLGLPTGTRVFASLGHASRGTVTAPFSGDLLAAWIVDDSEVGSRPPDAPLPTEEWRSVLRPDRRRRGHAPSGTR